MDELPSLFENPPSDPKLRKLVRRAERAVEGQSVVDVLYIAQLILQDLIEREMVVRADIELDTGCTVRQDPVGLKVVHGGSCFRECGFGPPGDYDDDDGA